MAVSGSTHRAAWASRCSGGHDLQPREVRAIAPSVAGQQDQPGDGCMRADVEVGQRGARCAAPSPVTEEALSRQESRFPRQRKSQEILSGQRVLEILDPLEPDRDLGVDEWIDRQSGTLRALGERVARPRRPLPILRENVEQDVAVDEDCQRLPRVSARISSVVSRTEPRPCSRCTIDFPRRPAAAPRRTFRIRTDWPTTSNSTSELGNRPSFSRISTGMVTWPFVVIRIVLPRQVILGSNGTRIHRLANDNWRYEQPGRRAAAAMRPSGASFECASHRGGKRRVEILPDHHAPPPAPRLAPPARLHCGDELRHRLARLGDDDLLTGCGAFDQAGESCLRHAQINDGLSHAYYSVWA